MPVLIEGGWINDNKLLPYLWGTFAPPATYGVDVTVKF